MLKKIYLLFISLSLFILLSNSDGRDEDSAGAPANLGSEVVCSSCHLGSSANGGSIFISGTPSSYDPGVSYPMSITVVRPDNDSDLSAAGFQIVATDGTDGTMQGSFTINEPAATRITSSGRMVQSSPRSFTNGQATWNFTWNAPIANAPENLVFYYAGNAVDENGSSFGDYGVNGSTSSTLPLEWVYFNVINIDSKSQLTWGTYNEINTSHFEIEISVDGRNFQNYGRVEAQGFETGLSEYEYAVEWGRGPKAYFRLKQVDLDGNSSFSQVVLKENNMERVKIIPSIINDFGSIEVKNDIAYYYILDAQARLISKISNQKTIDGSTLNTGLYFLVVVDEFGNSSPAVRFFKK